MLNLSKYVGQLKTSFAMSINLSYIRKSLFLLVTIGILYYNRMCIISFELSQFQINNQNISQVHFFNKCIKLNSNFGLEQKFNFVIFFNFSYLIFDNGIINTSKNTIEWLTNRKYNPEQFKSIQLKISNSFTYSKER